MYTTTWVWNNINYGWFNRKALYTSTCTEKAVGSGYIGEPFIRGVAKYMGISGTMVSWGRKHISDRLC